MFIDMPEPDHSRSGKAQCFRSWSGSRPYVSLRWSEEKSFCSRAFYKHLAPNGAKANNNLLHFQVEFAYRCPKTIYENIKN